MPYEVVIPDAQAAIVDLLLADTVLGGLLATKPTPKGGGPAIYDDGDAPDGQLFPFLTIGAWTQVPNHNFAPDGDGYGWNCTVQIKAIAQRQADLYPVLNAVAGVLQHGLKLSISGYPSSWCDELNVQPMLKVILAGKTTYELPAILRVFVA